LYFSLQILASMTPEAIRIIADLRREFYSLFATAMNVPVRVTGSSYSSNFPIASWIDNRSQVNYISIYAYTAPDKLIPQRPFLLRVAINKSAGRVTTAQWGRECRGLNQGWYFELTVLPEEILDFLPWVVSLVKAHDRGSLPLVQDPPHPFEFKVSEGPLSNDAWTQSALKIADSSKSQSFVPAVLPEPKNRGAEVSRSRKRAGM
jgi:hypothetical protein